MFNLFYKFNIGNRFSVLSDLGDLSGINYIQMSSLLEKWEKRFSNKDNYIDVEWEDNTTRIKIRYLLSTGCFIKILEEEWKSNKTLFLRT
jgi:hypothetical protein